MSNVDTNGLCTNCGGHGKTVGILTVQRPEMSPRQLRMLRNLGGALAAVSCTWCDGQDRVTPMMESQAEASLPDGAA